MAFAKSAATSTDFSARPRVINGTSGCGKCKLNGRNGGIPKTARDGIACAS